MTFAQKEARVLECTKPLIPIGFVVLIFLCIHHYYLS